MSKVSIVFLTSNSIYSDNPNSGTLQSTVSVGLIGSYSIDEPECLIIMTGALNHAV